MDHIKLAAPARGTVKVPSLSDQQAIVSLFHAGRLGEAEAAVRKLTQLFPADGFAWKVLGTVLAQQGHCESAWPTLQKAAELLPHDAETHNSLGVVLQELGRLDEAVASYQRAMEIKPHLAEAHNNLGNALTDLGRLDDAVACYQQAVTIKPNYAQAHYKRGNVLRVLGRMNEAVASYWQAVSAQPEFAEAHNNLGNVLTDLGRLEDAVASYQRAVEILPDYAQAHYNLGVVLANLHRVDDAVASYQRAVAILPDYAEAHSNLGNVLTDVGRLDDALASYLRAVKSKPDFAQAHYNLGVVLTNLGRPDEALARYRRAVEIQPDNLVFRSNLLFLHAFARVGGFQQEYEEARKWELVALSDAERQAARARVFAFENQPRQGRPLRLGIVSAELGQHAVSYFLTSFLGSIDPQRLTVLLYPTMSRCDAETAPLRALAKGWSPLFGRTDAEAAAQIRADGVDILVDTTGHTQGFRLGVFAHRAAPVQCHYIGYAGTTGLTEMDYFLADPVLIPKELDRHFQETVWRLPRPWVAYAPLEEAPDPAWCPANDGRIRLGSFNNLNKMSDSCLSLWARVLQALPEASLLLKDKTALDRAVQGRVVNALAAHGVQQDRVTFLPRVPDWRQHMSLYDQLDIALDTIPFGSGTTGFDALWMGVPLITLAGSWMGGRMGASMLTGMGHPEWIAHTDEEYVAKVVALGRDEQLRTQLRFTQRQRMRASPLCDSRDMARALADAFEAMYDQWWSRKHPPARQTAPAASSAERDALVGLFHAGRFTEAEVAARNLTQRFPSDGFAWKALGAVLAQQGRSESACHALHTATELLPHDAETHNTLGVVLKELGRLQEAQASYHRALTLQPDYAEAHSNLGIVLQDLGHLSEAMSSYQRAATLKPNDPVLNSNRLFLYAFSRAGSLSQEHDEARQWEQVVLTDAERQAARERVLEVSARQGRPLRLGIVSAELGQHAVSYFLTSFLGNIDRKRLTVLLYPTTSRGDAETAPLRALADSWSPLIGRSDAAAAAQIRADGVDILLDTTGHTQRGRLGIFAHRAAPVQCHYIGYAGTTGLTEMDYFLADPVLIPEELDGNFQETVWRLPRPWVAYAPLEEAPDPAWCPSGDGRIRLGSFNNLNKLSDACLSLWSRVLRALPEATLLLKDKMALDKSVQQRIVDTLAGHGVAKDRVRFQSRVPDWQRHMALYDQLDIALDTIPFGSGTTGFDALWMGVPLITLAGSWM
ncbi:MAG: tetratricopeptide repeat protein, partial [Pirellulaceae bacterium]